GNRAHGFMKVGDRKGGDLLDEFGRTSGNVPVDDGLHHAISRQWRRDSDCAIKRCRAAGRVTSDHCTVGAAATAFASGRVCESELPKLCRASECRPPSPPQTNSTMSFGSGVA